jgi:hypothetical protein
MSRRVLLRLSLFAAVALAAVITFHPALAGGTGQPDTKNRYPNVGCIVIIAGPGTPAVKASGVLIHPRVMLTAGHVTAEGEELIRQGVPLFDISRVSFGKDALDPSTWVEVEAIFTHPDYKLEPDSKSQDIGVIILKEPVGLPCAILAHEGLLDQLKRDGTLGGSGDPVKFTSVGYGSVLEFPPPEELLPDGLRRYSSPEFRAVENVWLLMNQNSAAGNSGIAGGDSGGPVFWRNPEGELILVALNSRTDQRRVALFKAYRTDIAEALGFIDFILALVEGGWL